jgi:hypothetical protein
MFGWDGLTVSDPHGLTPGDPHCSGEFQTENGVVTGHVDCPISLTHNRAYYITHIEGNLYRVYEATYCRPREHPEDEPYCKDR